MKVTHQTDKIVHNTLLVKPVKQLAFRLSSKKARKQAGRSRLDRQSPVQSSLSDGKSAVSRAFLTNPSGKAVLPLSLSKSKTPWAVLPTTTAQKPEGVLLVFTDDIYTRTKRAFYWIYRVLPAIYARSGNARDSIIIIKSKKQYKNILTKQYHGPTGEH